MSAPHIPDDELAALIKAGDERAFTIFYKEHYASLNFFTRKLLADEDAAKAVVLESFEKLWNRKQLYPAISDMRAFLYVTCRNHAYDLLRHRSRKLREAEVLAADVEELMPLNLFEETAEAAIIKAELYRQLYDEINKLTPAQKSVMELLLEGLSYQEIARRLNLSQEAIRKTKFMAVNRLRKQLMDKKILSLLLQL